MSSDGTLQSLRPVTRDWFTNVGDRPLVISHHGGSPPYTLAGYRAAYASGFRWFQVDVVPIRDDLVVQHSLFGWRRGFTKATIGELRQRYPDLVTLGELLDDPELADARWNIEVKSPRAIPTLARDLDSRQMASTVLLSAPWRPAIIHKLRDRFGEYLVVAAPVQRGGTLGIQFSVPVERDDTWQVLRRVGARGPGRSARRRAQAWKVRGIDDAVRLIDRGYDIIVDSTDTNLVAQLVERRPLPQVPPPEPRPPREPVPPGWRPPGERPPWAGAPAPWIDEPQMLLLGGGGWRGAFAAIGTVMFLYETKHHGTRRWQNVKEVAGVSGGAFAVATLAAEGVDDTDPTAALAALTARLTGVRRRLWLTVGLAAGVPAVLLARVGWTLTRSPRWEVSALLVLLPTAALLAARSAMQWVARRLIVTIVGTAPRRADNTNRRYSICATGAESGELYRFTTGPNSDDDRPPGMPPWPRGKAVKTSWRVNEAVLASTALPWTAGYALRGSWGPTRDDRGERLIDGGLLGILGDQLFAASRHGTASPGDSVPRLAIDSGRAHRRGPLYHKLIRLATVFHVGRWLKLAINALFRDVIERADDSSLHLVGDAQPMNRLLRLAEQPVGLSDIFAVDPAIARRIEHGRRLVSKVGLHRLSPRSAALVITMAVVLCSLEFDPPEMSEMDDAVPAATANDTLVTLLATIGESLGLGNRLVTTWNEL